MEARKEVWIYCRVNVPQDKHDRLEGQKKELMGFAEQMDFEIASISQDTASGLNFNRKGIAEVIEAAAEGKMDALLVTNVSRLGRDMLKTNNLIRKLNEQGIKVYSLLEG